MNMIITLGIPNKLEKIEKTTEETIIDVRTFGENPHGAVSTKIDKQGLLIRSKKKTSYKIISYSLKKIIIVA